jgi:excisionase family DNA binding protein
MAQDSVAIARSMSEPVAQARGVREESLLPEYLTLAQLARYVNVSERQLRNYLNLPPGQALPCYRPGRKVLVRRAEFDAWFAQYRSRGKPIVARVLRELGLDSVRLPHPRRG